MNVNKASPSSSSILGRTEPLTTFRSFHEDFPDTENPLTLVNRDWTSDETMGEHNRRGFAA